MKIRVLENVWKSIRQEALTILVTLFGLQLLRVLFTSLVGYLRDARGVSAINLAPLALGIFALAFLAPLPCRIAGARGALWFSAGGIALVRLVEQVSIEPLFDLVLSSIGVVLFLFYLPLAVGIVRVAGKTRETKPGSAIVLGLALDAAFQVASTTLDLSWQPGLLPIAVVAMLSVLILICTRLEVGRLGTAALADGRWSANLPLAAFGPWLLLHMLVFHNVAAISARTGLQTPLSGALILLTDTLALACITWLSRIRINLVIKVLVAGAALTACLAALQAGGLQAALLLVAGSVLSSYLITLIFTGAVLHIDNHNLWRTSISLGIGHLLFILLAFLYYLTYDLDLGFRSQALLPLSGLLVALLALVSAWQQRIQPEPQPALSPAFAALALALVPAVALLLWQTPAPVQPDPGSREVRVMTYNLHNGLNRHGRLDLEEQAKIIEASGAAVVGLQEISRGWLVWGNVDMLAWLSQRLDMAYVNGPTADAQWGNAMLSRYPVLSAELVPLPTEELLLRRGYILSEIEAGAGQVTVVVTHYHQVEQDSDIRLLQSQALLLGMPVMEATVLMGDMNATPDSPEMQLLAQSGLLDSAAQYGTQPTFTFTSDQPVKQIDYLWLTPDLAGTNFEIIQTTASDHLPVVITVELSH